jgi:putative membrane protein
MSVSVLSALSAFSAPSAHPHEGQPLAPHDLWQAWSFEPAVLIGLVMTGWLYLAGARRLWRTAGVGHGIRRAEASAFTAGWILLAIALISPLHRLGGALFSAHMVQHELLMAAAAPLLVLGRPVVALLWAVPMGWRRALGELSATSWVQGPWQLLTLPVVAWTVHAIAIWAWHAPALYQATLSSELVHTAQHLSFLGSGLLFWWSLLRAREGRLGRPPAVIYLFTTALHTSLLGVLLTFSGELWYPLYNATTRPWGLTALEDQQLAGLIMWIPGSLAYLVAALAIAASWLSEPRVVRFGVEAGLIGLLLAVVTQAACRRGTALAKEEAAQLTGGNPERGAVAIRHYGCPACHTIPGIPGANGSVGPPLAGIAGRTYIAGVLRNSPDNLTRWILNPPQVDPLTAMPYVGATAADARDMAAYLYTRK